MSPPPLHSSEIRALSSTNSNFALSNKKSLRGFSYSKNMVEAFHYTYSIKLSINLSFQKSVIRLSVSGWPCSRILVETKVNLWFTKLSQSILMMVCIFLHTHQRPTQLAKNIKKMCFYKLP